MEEQGLVMAHSKRVCEYGYTHSQCRCPSKDKAVIKITCDVPGHHSPDSLLNKVIDPEPVNKPWPEIIDDFLDSPEPLLDTIDRVLVGRLWWMKESERRIVALELERAINQR